MAPMMLFHPSNGMISHVDRLAPRLACLKLVFKQYETNAEEDIDTAVSRLAGLIQQAKLLRTLSLSINAEEEQSRRIFHGWGAGSHLSLLDLGHLTISQYDLTAIIVSQRDSLTELLIRHIAIEESGSWERFSNEIGQCLRLHKVTIYNLLQGVWDEADFYSDDPYLHMKRQITVARGIMQWVSPDMLVLESKNKGGYWDVLIASVKFEERDIHEV